jgi:hypothetical protein
VSYPPPPPGGPPPPPPGDPFPPQGYPGPGQPWPPQQPWAQGPQPKKRGNGWKWALGAVALLAVIGVTAAVTISVRKDGGDGGPTPTGDTYGLASADDTGPVNIITEDPSCAAWRPINETFAAKQRQGWDRRDSSIPAVDWTPEQRADYEEVGQAMIDAADQTIPLAKVTPHRVMREMYEQFGAYARAYADAIPSYVPADDHLAGVAVAASSTLAFACAAIEWKSAQARAPLVQVPPPPTEVAILSDPSSPPRFLTTADKSCGEWTRALKQFHDETTGWQNLDANVPASEWTPNQRQVADDVVPVMTKFADDIEALGRSSSNPTLQDFAVFSAQYRRAYAAALPTYTPADSFLARTAARTTSVIYEACHAVGG